MIALLCIFLTLFASPFKSKSRLEAENAFSFRCVTAQAMRAVLFASARRRPASAAAGAVRSPKDRLWSPSSAAPEKHASPSPV
jgi:hypothetical protein